MNARRAGRCAARLVPLGLAAALLAGCSAGSGSDSAGTPGATSGTGSTAATAAPTDAAPTGSAAADGEVQVVKVTGTKQITFAPDRITVRPGRVRVEFTVPKGSAPHSFTVADLGVDTGVFDGDTKTVEFTVAKPGTYTYICTVHPSMTGQLVVG